MTDIRYEADFPGETAGEALTLADEAAKTLPFSVDWCEVEIHNFWESATARSHKDDEDALQEFRDKEWAWIATLKAKGHLA